MFGLFNKKKFTESTSSAGGFGWLSWGRASAPMLDKESALEVSAILAATKVIAKNIAKTPLRVVEKKTVKGKSVTRVIHDHWAQNLLNNPNPVMTQYEFMYWVSVNALLGGGALIYKREGVSGRVIELLPVLKWEADPQSFGQVNYTIYHANDQKSVVTDKEVILIKFDTLDGFSGINNLEKARTAAGIVKALEAQTLSTAVSGGRPSGVITAPQMMGAEVIKNVKADWDHQYKAGGEAGIAFLDAGMNFTPISQSAVDSQMDNTRRFYIEEIGRIFGVSPYYLFSNQSNISSEEAERALFRDTIVPHFVAIEQTLKKALFAKEPRMYWDFDDETVLRGDPAKQIPVYAQALGAGGTPNFLTLNEVREALGYDASPEPFADKLSSGGYGGVSGLGKDET